MVLITGTKYALIPYSMGYQACELTGKTGKNGKPDFKCIGYCTTVEEGLRIIKRDITRQKLSQSDYELSEAIKEIKRINNELLEAVKGV